MREFYGFIGSYVLSPLSLGGGAIFFAMLFVLPALVGLVVTVGDWKTVLKSFLIWFGGLLGLFFLASGKVGDTLHGALLYGMFFSIVAVPCLAVLLKISAWVKTRFWPRAMAT